LLTQKETLEVLKLTRGGCGAVASRLSRMFLLFLAL